MARQATLKPYRLKAPRKPTPPDRGPRAPAGPDETIVLSGQVNGKAASRDEELFAMALGRQGIGFDFNESYIAGRNLPGEVRPDFIVYAGAPQPVNIDNEQWHHTAAQKADAAAKDAMLAAHLGGGWAPPLRIPMPSEVVNDKDNQRVLDWMRQQVRRYFT